MKPGSSDPVAAPLSEGATDGATDATDGAAGPTFGSRVAGVFVTRMFQFGFALLVTFALARLLGPAGRGIYYTLTLIPGTLYALATFGLPSSLTFFSGRGASLPALRRQALGLGLAASTWLILGTVALLPVLRETVLQTVPGGLLPWILATIPFQFTGSLLGTVLYGRQEIRVYNLIQVAQSAATLVLVLALVGGLGLGVFGAVLTYFATVVLGAIAVLVELGRVIRRRGHESGGSVSSRSILGYGFRLYPAVVSGFFNYRADVYLLNWLLDSAAATGLYSLAVSLAEITFYVPDSVSSIFLPRVAGSSRESADRSVSDVARLTVLLTALAGLAVMPLGVIAIVVILPAFVGSIPAFLILLPGVVALSLSKVLAGYVTGLGSARPTVVASVSALVANVALNVVLIPAWGIVGAASASLISYSLNAGLMLRAASRLSGVDPHRFVVPERADLVRVVTILRAVLERALALRQVRNPPDRRAP